MMPHKVGWKRLVIAACALLALQAVLACAVGVGRPFRGDEPHFVETIVQFGTQPLTLDLLAHYDEMSGPVPFVLYGTWGRFFGFEPQTLRLFSILVALATCLLWFWFLQGETGSARLAASGTAFVALHPYMLYLSLFVYTDMLAILCLIGSLIAVRRQRPLLLAAFLCGAVLNRQYLIFASAAAGLYFLARYWKSRRRQDAISMLAVAGSAMPLAAFCLLWRGLCPDGALKQVYLDQHVSFHVSSLVLYVSLTALYLAPVLALGWKGLFPTDTRRFTKVGCCRASQQDTAVAKASHAPAGDISPRENLAAGEDAPRLAWTAGGHSFAGRIPALAALSLCGLYWFFPVGPSRSAVEAGIFQVGMLHQTLHFLFGSPALEHAVFFTGFALGLAVVARILMDATARWRRGEIDFRFFLDLNVVFFLAVMPFSYLNWEKYFMPLVPVLVLRIAFVPLRGEKTVAEHVPFSATAPQVVPPPQPARVSNRAA